MVDRYVPDPKNQFNRLAYVSGPKGWGTYATALPWNNMHNGSDYDNRNCTPTVTSAMRDAETGGASRPSPNLIRNHQQDWNGGIGWPDAAVAWDDLYGDSLTIPFSADWTDLIAIVRAGHPVGVGGIYSKVPSTFQTQKGGTFDHAFGVFDFRYSDSSILWLDTLARRLSWVPQYALRAAVEALALRERGTKSRLFMAYAKPAPLVGVPQPAPGYRVVIQPTAGHTFRGFWEYNIKNGKITGRDARRTKGFRAGCSKPQSFYWAGHGRYTLVQIREGGFAGLWVGTRYLET